MIADSIKTEAMSNVDAAWFHMETPTNLMMITGIFIFPEMVDFQRLKKTLEQRLLPFNRFRQRVVEPRFGLGSPQWEPDPSFHLDNHLHRIGLPAPGNQQALQDLVSDLMSTPLDTSKPLWQIHLVENFQGGCALVCRLHHCIADGIALMRVLLSMTDESRDAVWTPSEEKEKSAQGFNPFRIITRPAATALGATRRITGALVSGGVEMIANPGAALDLARLGTETTLALGRLVLLPPDPKTLFKGPLGVQKRAAWTQPISLADIKAIRQVTGTTVNDVMLAAVAGALRRYLVGRGQRVEGLNFRAVVPVNLRGEEEKSGLGNRFGLFFLSLPIGIADPFERLMELKRRMDELKGTPEAVVAFGILNAIGMAPAEIENIVVNIFGMKATAVMTNVPGPRRQIYLAGAPIEQIMFWVPQSGRLGLGVSILSYNDQVLVGFATDAGMAPDPETMAGHLHEEIAALLALVREAEKAASAGDDLTRLRGIGPAYAASLRAGGVATFAALAASTPEQLAAIIQAPDWRRPDYAGWIEQASRLRSGG